MICYLAVGLLGVLLGALGTLLALLFLPITLPHPRREWE